MSYSQNNFAAREVGGSIRAIIVHWTNRSCKFVVVQYNKHFHERGVPGNYPKSATVFQFTCKEGESLDHVLDVVSNLQSILPLSPVLRYDSALL